ncbi:MAG: restriction endonuclease [Anaerolineae bacterium]|nr:restriction endonuclease [Anaerolineae bacterium]
MALKPLHVWMVRSGNDNILANLVEDKGAVAVGWDEMGDLSQLQTREQFKRRYQEVFPEDSEGRVPVNAGQIYRFAKEIHLGDYVITYIKDSREIVIGIVESEYEFNPTLFGVEYPHVRHVKWIKRVSRDIFSPEARNTLGSTLTVFILDNILDEIYSIATQKGAEPKVPEEVIEDAPPFYKDVRAKADELIADLISRLDPYDFQDLVAALLEAMGFNAKSSPPGRDRGVDVIAHPDAFGFGTPRIKVQVKHRKGAATGPEMRSFMGVLRSGENGLFVSTGVLLAMRSWKPSDLANQSSCWIEVILLNCYLKTMRYLRPSIKPKFR